MDARTPVTKATKSSSTTRVHKARSGASVVGRWNTNRPTTVATWIDRPQPDPWMAAYSPKTEIIKQHQDLPLFEGAILGDEKDIKPIRDFILPDSHSRRWEHLVQTLENFCKGADFALENFVPHQLPGQDDQCQITAWVSDRNENTQSPSAPLNNERDLSAPQLYKVLQQKRLREKPTHGTATHHPLRIYINHADGPCILSLIKTALPWQAQGYRELLSYYIIIPEPRIGVHESHLWGGCFIIHFNIPSFALGNSDREDSRTINGKRKLRRRFDLSYLNPSNATDAKFEEEHGFLGSIFLHEVTCSFMLTGQSETNWSAVCLDEDAFDIDDELDTDGDGLWPDDNIDPILDSPSLNITPPPRSYSLAFLARYFMALIDRQREIADLYRASLDCFSPNSAGELPGQVSAKDIKQWTRQSVIHLKMVRNSIREVGDELGRFLEQQVIFGEDEIPHGRLFRSLEEDALAIKSLKSLQRSRTELKAAERAIERHQKQFERLQLENRAKSHHQRRDETAKAQHELAEKVGTLTRVNIILSLITHLVGVLAIAVQLYGNAGKTIIVVLIILVACLGITSITTVVIGRRFPGAMRIWPWVRREESGCQKKFERFHQPALTEYNISLARGFSSAIQDFCKRGIEDIAGCRLSWWPLSEPEEELEPGHTRVYSMPLGRLSQRFYDDIPTSLAEQIFPKLVDARLSAPRLRWAALSREAVVLQDTTLTRLLHRWGYDLGRDRQRLVSEEQCPQGSQAVQRDGQSFSEQNNQSAPKRDGWDPAKSASDQRRDQSILFISADINSNESVACTVDLGKHDKTTFQNLRAALRSLPSWGWKRATGIKFYRFQSFHFKESLKRHYVVIDKDKERYPKEADPEYGSYKYTPSPWEDGKPCPCLSGEAWYFFQNPDECCNSTALNAALPVLLNTTPNSRIKAWGVYIEQRHSVLPILIPAIILVSATLGATFWFIAPWLKDHPGDLQNATVPVIVAFTVIGFFLQLLISLLIFRWSI